MNHVDSPTLLKVIETRTRDLGGFSVRRLLPYPSHRMVGPFVFFDHMGPADFPPTKGIDVRPHPHIGLATVTYLFDGAILHKDSLGSEQRIEEGAINWMTAGRGIVHSERTPIDLRAQGFRLNGIQLWVALPEEFEEIDPSFTHHPKESLPEFANGKARLRLLLGKAFGRVSPVAVHSDLFYIDVRIEAGETFCMQLDGREGAIYIVTGRAQIDGIAIEASTMAVIRPGQNLEFTASENSHVMVIGGSSLGPREIFWNLVSSSKAKIEDAKQAWSHGPTKDNRRFHPIEGDDKEFIPLPSENA